MRLQIPRPFLVAEYALLLAADDGVVLYVNGIEVIRSNLQPAQFDGWWTQAVANVPASESRFTTYRLPSALFRAGSNTIAAVVKQADRGYDDMLFDLVIIAPPLLTTSLLTAFQPSACVSKPENDPTLLLWSTLFPSVAADAAIVIQAGQRVLLDVTTLPRLFSITIRCVDASAQLPGLCLCVFVYVRCERGSEMAYCRMWVQSWRDARVQGPGSGSGDVGDSRGGRCGRHEWRAADRQRDVSRGV